MMLLTFFTEESVTLAATCTFMTMMSIESIELDKQSEADGGANNFFNKEKIEEEY